MLKHEIYSLKQYQISIYYVNNDIIYLASIVYDLKNHISNMDFEEKNLLHGKPLLDCCSAQHTIHVL